MRIDSRQNDQLREIKITRGYTKYAEGSVLIEFGDTKVICTATVEENVPPFRKDSGLGWVTAEYAMLPRATQRRNQRDISKLRLNNRSSEIQRLIGRALRSAVDFTALGERTVTIDCDVIQADGGTRTASITGGFIAMAEAMIALKNKGLIAKLPFDSFVAAVSVGVVGDTPMLDLNYVEDSGAKVDMNVVMTEKGEFIELQGTGEDRPFKKEELDALIGLAQQGINQLIIKQKEALKDIY